MTIAEQVATYLQDELLVGTLGTNIFIGRLPEKNDAPVNAIAVIDTGGVASDVDLPLTSPTFQILIRNTDYDAGSTLLMTIHDGLHQFFGELVTGQNYFYVLHAQNRGGHLGQDASGRELFSINFISKVR